MVVLDSWALLAYLKDELSAERIEAAWLQIAAPSPPVNIRAESLICATVELSKRDHRPGEPGDNALEIGWARAALQQAL